VKEGGPPAAPLPVQQAQQQQQQQQQQACSKGCHQTVPDVSVALASHPTHQHGLVASVVPLQGDPVSALVRSCLLEDRGGERAFSYAPPGAAGGGYLVKWSFHNVSLLPAARTCAQPDWTEAPERTVSRASSVTLAGRSLRSLWLRGAYATMVQALQLVVVAVHAKALSLLYVDQLLEDVKQVSFVLLCACWKYNLMGIALLPMRCCLLLMCVA
jgi:hypothetical protein